MSLKITLGVKVQRADVQELKSAWGDGTVRERFGGHFVRFYNEHRSHVSVSPGMSEDSGKTFDLVQLLYTSCGSSRFLPDFYSANI